MRNRKPDIDDETARRIAVTASYLRGRRIGVGTVRAMLAGRETPRACFAVRATSELWGYYVPVGEDKP